MNAEAVGLRLNQLLVHAGLAPLDGVTGEQFAQYLSLIMRWNGRLNLSSIRNEDGILSRHFVESIACARALPVGISTLLDFGSGAGLPGIPIALCRPEISVVLAESQGKKAAFLQEALRTLALKAAVHAGRAEQLGNKFGCVALRAVDRMPHAVKAARPLVGPAGWLALMTTRSDLAQLQNAAGSEFSWPTVVQLPGAAQRLLALGARKVI
jgi:16S rRNA (guanine527-N7)-methyltransferase